MTDLQICSSETMERAICELGIVPFFTSAIPGYSIKELTQPGFWFDGEEDSLGPWDWKIDCLQNGGIAYGKFLCGGKAAFATVPFYRELMNIRRATTTPDKNGERIMEYLEKQGSITIKEVRALLDVKKGQADAVICKLMQQCRVVTGAIERVYRGPEQVYNGWQVSYFCTPESLFEDFTTLHTDHTPEESLEFLVDHITRLTDGTATRKQVLKVLK
ncbi:MAG: hypothetical protein IKM99_05455 [Bacteroidales bacterium]|nr:hypothetical protein [Bacteroidales bacterium]